MQAVEDQFKGLTDALVMRGEVGRILVYQLGKHQRAIVVEKLGDEERIVLAADPPTLLGLAQLLRGSLHQTLIHRLITFGNVPIRAADLTPDRDGQGFRSEEHTSELQSRE